jgi:ligand-binding sensor domain-containing protein
VRFDPKSGTATWKDISYNLGDQPVTSIAYNSVKGDLFVSTDFGVLKLDDNAWSKAASDLPRVAVYGLTIDESGRVLYAATHGRGAYRLDL